MLRSLPSQQLRHMVSRLSTAKTAPEIPTPGPPASKGIRPDLPPGGRNVGTSALESAQTPERPTVDAVIKGIRPTPIIATAAALLIGGAAVAKCSGACDEIDRSDAPTTEEQADG